MGFKQLSELPEKQNIVGGEKVYINDNGVSKQVDIDKVKSNQLPEVTSDDDGKVLRVVDGEWDKGEVGTGTFVVTFTVTPEALITADKTYDEVMEAMKIMPVVGILKVIDDGEEQIIPLGIAIYSSFNSYETPCWFRIIDRNTILPIVGWDSENRNWKMGA